MGFHLSDLNPINAVKKLPKAAESVLHKAEDAGKAVVHEVKDDAMTVAFDAMAMGNRIVTKSNGTFFASALDGKRRDELMAAAKDPAHDGLDFQGGSTHDLLNKHRTNTPQEMLDGLKGPYTCLEGDVRMEKGVFGLGHRQAIMAHDAYATDGMTLKDWMSIGKASGRMIKLDFKEPAALGQAIENAKQLKIDDQKLMFNGTKDLDFDRLRKEFPNATLAINPKGDMTPEDIKDMTDIAQRVGKPAIFPVRRDLVTPELVEKLKPYGEVAVWGYPNKGETPKQAHDAMRKAGVDGMIDIEH
jgi:hypothetical protein